ncbi:DNA mismatch repair protein MutS [Flavobacteriaceae bacterium]|nr:DNA mismatch repair protein MutS [Flavobacteriaceae bacterium]
MIDPKTFYTEKITSFSAQVSRLQNQLIRSSMLRLGVFIALVFGVYFFFENTKAIGVVLLFGIALFLFLITRHQDIKYKRDLLLQLIAINKKELKILNRDFHEFETGSQYQDPTHSYSHDIDLFGVGSFFQYANRTTLQSGTDTFARLLTSNDITGIPQKQEAVKELASLPDWRQQFAAVACLVQTKTKTKTVTSWLKAYEAFVPKHIPLLSTLFSVISGVCVVSYFFGLISGYMLFGWFLIGLIISGVFIKKVNKLATHTTEIHSTFQQYYKLIIQIETQDFKAALLQDQKKKIETSGQKASAVLQKFSRYLSSLDQRNNILIGVLTNGFMLRDMRVSHHIEKWIMAHKKEVSTWFEVLHFFDGYTTLGAYAFNHPSQTYPSITDGASVLNMQGAAHPLLDPQRAVSNTMQIDTGQFFIITGANMAGKSTFLRTVALQIVMANMGLPTPAAQSQYSPIKLITSMRTTDNLTQDASYFFSELQRLKYIVQEIEKDTYFIILDEILKGTNSQDKASGSKKFIEKLVQSKATGIIATHDLSLCETANTYSEVENYYFDASIENDELYFDYIFKKGICQNRNASFLLKKMGIVN